MPVLEGFYVSSAKLPIVSASFVLGGPLITVQLKTGRPKVAIISIWGQTRKRSGSSSNHFCSGSEHSSNYLYDLCHLKRA